jgi:hypothetical protein
MKLHAKKFSFAAGAKGDEVEIVSRRLAETQKVSASAAEALLTETAGSKNGSSNF